MEEKQHIFIVGCKGIPARYGGYETFVDKLIQYQKNQNIKYHVACATKKVSFDMVEFEYYKAHCFNIEWKKLGAAKAIFYDIDAIKWCINYIKKHKIQHPIVYVLACRIGPFFNQYVKQIHALDGKVYVNPDGHEWMRAKWSVAVRKYWKISERLMVKHADLLICDSKNIEKYIQDKYDIYKTDTTFIAYGAEISKSALADDDEKVLSWYRENGLKSNEYFLVVGRFVPENNYKTMIQEFMKSKTKRNFALITNVSDKFLKKLKAQTGFDKDPRIKFVGTVYDQELLKKIRENAYGYFHGHEVGGTNPSLLEAMSSTELNLLLEVGFNREVAEDGAIYWNKECGNLSALIEQVDTMSKEEIAALGMKAHSRIVSYYSWDYIVDEYETLFLKKF